MDLLFILVDIVIAGFGFYALYCGLLLKNKNIVTKQILVSKDMEFKKCRDIEGYKNWQGFYVSCIEEIAWRRKFITDKKLLEIADSLKGTEYGDYLKSLVKEK